METKQTAVEWLFLKMNRIRLDYEIGNLNDLDFIENQKKAYKEAKQMEKEQMKDAFVACWESNVPDGIECKLDAEQYYNETYGK